MSCYLQAEASAAVAPPPRTLSVPGLCRRATVWLRLCRQRRQERAELLFFMAADRRAAADIGVTTYDVLDWSRRPFWRA
jgi:uncharacterized protein YjiS (DUF1127 family)